MTGVFTKKERRQARLNAKKHADIVPSLLADWELLRRDSTETSKKYELVDKMLSASKVSFVSWAWRAFHYPIFLSPVVKIDGFESGARYLAHNRVDGATGHRGSTLDNLRGVKGSPTLPRHVAVR